MRDVNSGPGNQGKQVGTRRAAKSHPGERATVTGAAPLPPWYRFPETSGKASIRLNIGEVKACAEPTILHTLLGSCVTTCLFDPVAGVGGMNHILLPTAQVRREGHPHLRFGLDAIDRLIDELIRLGAFAPRLLAKVFGGGHVINAIDSQFSPGDRIVEGVLARLQHLRIPVVGQDTGGIWTRVVQFHTDSFHVLVRKTASGHSQVLATEEDRVRRSLEPGGTSC